MQTQNQPTGKAQLLSYDGELRTALPFDADVFLVATFEQSKKGKYVRRRPFILSWNFWFITLAYSLASYILLLLFALARENLINMNSILVTSIVVVVVSLAGTVGNWRVHRHVALGFLGGLIGTVAVAVIYYYFVVAVLPVVDNFLNDMNNIHPHP